MIDDKSDSAKLDQTPARTNRRLRVRVATARSAPTATTKRRAKSPPFLRCPICRDTKFQKVARAERVRPSLKNYFFFLAFAFLAFFTVLAFFAFFAIASSYVG
jgi:hypothetical protein